MNKFISLKVAGISTKTLYSLTDRHHGQVFYTLEYLSEPVIFNGMPINWRMKQPVDYIFYNYYQPLILTSPLQQPYLDLDYECDTLDVWYGFIFLHEKDFVVPYREEKIQLFETSP